jgi:hypothetical protein
MIGKQIKGKGFRGLLNYLEGKEQAQLIGGNMSGRNAPELSAEFGLSRALNPHAKRKVYHASLSLPFNERLTNQQWGEVAAKYLEQMGYVNNQYAVYRHYDQDHDHIHIIASRIRLDTAKIVHDSWDYKRSEVVIRKLEREYGLQEVVSSSERIERNSSTGQRKRIEREEEDYHQGRREMPPELSIKQKLQQLILVAAANQPTMEVFFERLQDLGVEVKHGYTRTGKSKGISYGYQEQAFSGTKLGAAYTFPGLQKHLGIDEKEKRDKHRLKQDDYQSEQDAYQSERDEHRLKLDDYQYKHLGIDEKEKRYEHQLKQDDYQPKQYDYQLEEDDYQSKRDEQQLKQGDYQSERDELQRKHLLENASKVEDYTEQVSSVVPKANIEQNQAQNLYIHYSKSFEHLTPDERDKKVIVQAFRDNVSKALIQDILSASSIKYSSNEREELVRIVYEKLVKQQQLLSQQVQQQHKPKSIAQDFER